MERIEPQVVPGPVGTAATILWDRWGIAHISADEPYDLGVGLGYAVARERLWQLDYMRRRVRGELAAVLGPEALASDREMRTIGIAAAADTVAQTISGTTATLLEGLAAGINAWRRTAVETAALPEEFGILDYQPAPWTPAESVALWRWRWWMLTGRLEPVALIEAARRTLPADLLEAFLGVEAGEETIVPGPADGTPGPIPGGDASGEGSNNWAVAGSRTTTGFPVLCSDPHNTFDQPSQWFQAQLTCPAIGLDSIGAVYVGTASAYIGRNRHTAWGVTNHVAPIRDLYIEETDSPDGNRYRDGTAWRPFETERHTIKVRGAPDETLTVRRTVRGPIVNDLLPWTPTAEGGVASPISLRWRGLEAGVASGLEAMLAVNCARNVDETLAALEQWPGPVLNFVFADRDGRIGYHVASHIPRRQIALRGLRPANDPDHAWQGTLPFDRLPQLIDPARGWVATANNPPWAEDPPDMPYLGLGGWSDGYRFRRIRERLEGGPARLSPDEIAAIQGDVLHARAVDLLPALIALLRTCPRPAATRRLSPPRGLDRLVRYRGGERQYLHRVLATLAGTHRRRPLPGAACAARRRPSRGCRPPLAARRRHGLVSRHGLPRGGPRRLCIRNRVVDRGGRPRSDALALGTPAPSNLSAPARRALARPDAAVRSWPLPDKRRQWHRACRRPSVRAAFPGDQRLDLPLLRRSLPVGIRRGHEHDRPIGASR